ncbi:MAG TPA: helix-turn-helix transcriptional regulator [Rhodothermales bacterium]|nr:helix-turn-helix transcriptional regulator [Rhodothermales bacterium]
MGLYLNTEQVKLLGEVQRALLSPLESPTLDHWRSRVNGSLRRLFGCDRTCFLLQASDEVLYYSDDTDPRYMAMLQHALDPASPDPPDAYWQEANLARIRGGLTAWHERMFCDRTRLERTRYYNEVHAPAGVRYMMGLSRYGDTDEATINLGFMQRDAPFYSEAGVQLLGLLAPAFEAGVQMRRRAQLPAPEEVQRRFGLTRREAEAALLMARGVGDRAMSECMFVSLNTARRHAETVLKKLNVHSRSAVALTLMDALPPSEECLHPVVSLT